MSIVLPMETSRAAASPNEAEFAPPVATDHEAHGPAPWPRWLWAVALGLVLLGLAWRTVRYFERFPIWGDEAFVCLNFLDRDYLGLLRPLRFAQVAPVLFLWTEYTVHQLLGGSEMSLRLLPFLAGLAAVGLFWRLARITLSPMAGALATGILAVSYYPVRHACEAKPYAFDLAIAVVLFLVAAAWMKEPRRLKPLAALTLFLPLALGISYPAVFVAGAISIAILPIMWRQSDWGARGMYLLFSAVLLASFFGWYYFVGLGQYSSAHGAENNQWDMWFPPNHLIQLLEWLAAAHSGNMLAYPLGGPNAGSVFSGLLCLAGAWQLGRSRRWELLLLLLCPFVLTLCAAALHRYPYGGSARVAQHLAPAICLLAGNGAAWCFGWFQSAAARRRCMLATCGLLAIIGVVGLSRDLVRPYKAEGDRVARRLAQGIAAQSGADDQVIVIDEDWRLPPGMEWYLRQSGAKVFWNAQMDRQLLTTATRRVWVFLFCTAPQRLARLSRVEAELTAGPRIFELARQAECQFPFGWDAEHADRCRVFYWVHREEATDSGVVIMAAGDARSIGSGLAPAALDMRP
jgi:hypothetical protein